MKIERQKAMVKSVAKAMKQKEREQAKKDKLRDNITKVCNKYNKAIDELVKSELTKPELKLIQEYYINSCGLSVAVILYPEFF